MFYILKLNMNIDILIIVYKTNVLFKQEMNGMRCQ